MAVGRSSEIDSKVVCRMKGPSVKAGETKVWFVDNFPVPVPSVPPSDSDSYGCVQYITIQYELRVTHDKHLLRLLFKLFLI